MPEPDIRRLLAVVVAVYFDKESQLWWTTCEGFFECDHEDLSEIRCGMLIGNTLIIPFEDLDEKTQVALERIARRIIAEDRAPNNVYIGPFYDKTRLIFGVTEDDIQKALSDTRPLEAGDGDRKYVNRPLVFGLKRYRGKALNV
jgi:hypothetical protein